MRLLDLPAELLALIAAKCTQDERHSLDLAGKPLLTAVRSTWRTVALNTRSLPRRPPPRGLALCPGIERVVLCRQHYHPSLEHCWEEGTVGHIEREPSEVDVERVGPMLRQLAALLRPADAAEPACSRGQRPLALVCLLPHGTELSALTALLRTCCAAPTKAAKRAPPATAAAGDAAVELLAAGMKRMFLGPAPRLTAAAQQAAAAPRRKAATSSRLGARPWRQGHPFTSLEVRHAAGLDGACAELLTATGACWSPPPAAGATAWRAAQRGMHLAPYSRLRRLVLTVPPSSDPEAADKFAACLAVQLPALPALTSLQLGRPEPSDSPTLMSLANSRPLQLALSGVALPQLKRLDLTEQVAIESLEELTHLAALSSLSIWLPESSPEGHMGRVGALAELPALRCLTLGHWRPAEADAGLSALRQLTALHLHDFVPPAGFSLAGCLPAVQAASLCCMPPMPSGDEWVDGKCPVLEWGRRIVCQAPLDLPAVQELRLRLPRLQVQPLRKKEDGCMGRTAYTPADLEQALEGVDSQALHVLGAARRLERLVVDVKLAQDLKDSFGTSEPSPAFWDGAQRRLGTLANGSFLRRACPAKVPASSRGCTLGAPVSCLVRCTYSRTTMAAEALPAEGAAAGYSPAAWSYAWGERLPPAGRLVVEEGWATGRQHAQHPPAATAAAAAEHGSPGAAAPAAAPGQVDLTLLRELCGPDLDACLEAEFGSMPTIRGRAFS
ncbi:hypothetical protein ABPG75_011968 [Micractinium tetrahymenae]